jgi:septum formation protein
MDQSKCIIGAVRLVLASASPRRRELLAAAGFQFDVDPMDVDERAHPGEAAAAYVERIARTKAAAAAARHPDRVVLAADTAVVVDFEILGKPADDRDAARMLRQIAGRAHEVLTGVAVARQGAIEVRVERTRVWCDPMTDAEIAAYVASGEPRDKAGAYGIQGLASTFVRRIDGSYTNVVGLPVATVASMLKNAG